MVWSTAKGRTAIPANSKGVEGGCADVKGDVADPGTGRFLAVVGVLGLAVALVVLPVVIALGAAPAPIGRAVAVVGAGLAAVLGAVQLAAVILGVLGFVGSNPRGRIAAASSD